MELSEIDKNIRAIKSYLNKINNPIENTNRNKKIKGTNVQKLSETFQSNIDENKNENNNNNEFKTITSSLKNYNDEITSKVDNIKQNDDKLIQKLGEIIESLISFKNNFDLGYEANHRFILQEIKSRKYEYYYFKKKKLNKDEVLYKFKMYLKIKSFLYLFIYNNKHFSQIINYDNSINYEKIIKDILNQLNLNTDINGCWIYKNNLNQIDIQKKESDKEKTSHTEQDDLKKKEYDKEKKHKDSDTVESKKNDHINFRLLIFFKDILLRQDINNINFILN